METTSRQLAEAMAPSGWRLEKAPVGQRKERWGWKMVHGPTGSEVTCDLLGQIGRTWREFCRIQLTANMRAETVAGWLASGEGPGCAVIGEWLASGDAAMPSCLIEAVSALPHARSPRQWLSASAHMTVVSPPGHHGFKASVLEHLAHHQRAALGVSLPKAPQRMSRRRL
ncbi:hypothetical protein FIV34_12165 [Luteibacter pinisoli]|uniref:Uncharacterized protein n=1 Tax=Luteibacter pinisoli TaxID=2589080 RepID=A0A4Y5Z6K0_9GAMM|nr:hypothetical protein [Luteibacter pinisoli]QDE39913.1 hypothetical protein FIV34_12165 [Luteibacter pinisoli]